MKVDDLAIHNRHIFRFRVDERVTMRDLTMSSYTCSVFGVGEYDRGSSFASNDRHGRFPNRRFEVEKGCRRSRATVSVIQTAARHGRFKSIHDRVVRRIERFQHRRFEVRIIDIDGCRDP